jgi:predicted hydrocarbon binding protein
VTIPGRELAETIRFAMEATKDLKPSDSQSHHSAIENLGAELGHEVARIVSSRKNKDLLEALTSFWRQNGLGDMAITQTDPLVVRLSNCYDCKRPRDSGHPASCALKRSLLESTFRDSLGPDTRIEEVECCKTGGPACVFRLRPR